MSEKAIVSGRSGKVGLSWFLFLEAQHMKTLLSIASVLVLSAAPALAGDGQVSHKSLAKMGLSGMQTMTDSQGMKIRGTSIAVAAGGSIAFIGTKGGGAASVNTYFAAGSHSASGDNLSGAAALTVSPHSATLTIVAAGGFSSASAH
jgi:hypothetical protein